MTKVKEEFVVGKNNIGWVDSDFSKEFGEDELTEGKVLKSQKLPRGMYDKEIISELGIQECTLGDVLKTIQEATPDIKDGNWNLFYIKGYPSHVVSVHWSDGEWDVDGWNRGDGWVGGRRVFTPATPFESGASSTSPSSPLKLDICECERCSKCGKRIK